MRYAMDVVEPQADELAVEVSGALALAWLGRCDPEDVLEVDVDSPHVDADAAVEVLSATQQLLGRVQAQQLQAVERLRRARGDDREAADEAGLALSVSKHVADRQVDLARELAARYPRLRAALRRGEIDAAKAARVVETGLALDDDKARALDEHMSGRLVGRDATAIQQSARYRVDRLDPEGAAQRAERCRRRRKVELLPAADGMADLAAYLPAEVAAAAYARIDALARSDNSRGDERGLDEIRADVFADLLLGNRQSYKTVQVQVTVPVSTLLGSSELPGELDGYGWIPASVARQMAADPGCRWRRLLTDPATGQLLEVGRRRYRPPAQLDEFVRARDRHCRVPGCRRPARACDIDHNHDWQYGGPTDECLLCCLCRRHHRLKDRPGWQFQMHNGDLIITTPTGRRYRSLLPRCAEPEPEPDAIDTGVPPY